MGTDISGFIECREPVWLRAEPRLWRTAIELDLLYDVRDYDAFGCLFGVRNYADFRPLAANRGLPPDLSAAVEEAATRTLGYHSATWISWAEVAAVDWDECADGADQRLHRYRRQIDGSLKYDGKAMWEQGLTETTGIPAEEIRGGRVSWEVGQEFVLGDVVFRAEILRRRDAVSVDGNWKSVWRVMETLAERAGPDDVRLVVWFDD